MGRVTDVAPAGLVPAAWLVTAGVLTGAIDTHALFVALVVMSVLLVAFLAVGRDEMDGPVLRIWKWVIAAGIPATLAGVVGLALEPPVDALAAVSLLGWMFLPGLAYLPTGQAVETTPYREVYVASGALSLVGGLLALFAATGLLRTVAPVVAVIVVGVGQSAGMVAATVQNRG